MTLCKSEQHFKLYVEEDMSGNKVKQWFAKWDRTIAAITAAVVFCTIVVLVIVKIESDDDDEVTYKKNKQMGTEFGFTSFKIPASQPACQDGNGIIMCNGGTIDDICGILSNCSNRCETPITLILQSFTLLQIGEGWLNCSFYQISSLTIDSNNLIEYNKGAFSGLPFSQTLTDLILKGDTKLFKKEMFENSSIKSLQIECENYNKFEENAFGDIAYSLSSLSILKCIGEISALKNIVGSEETLINVKFLELRYNIFPNLDNYSLQAVPNVESLFLGSCKINSIEVGAFEKMQGLIILDLSNNILKTLPEGIFQRQWRGISITNNSWNCNCDLVWLRDLNDNFPECFATCSVFMCDTDDGKKPYKDVDFCPITTSSLTTKLTTEMSTSTTILPPTSSSEPSPTTTTDDTTTTFKTTTETTLVPTTSLTSTTETTFSTRTPTESTASTETPSTETTSGATTTSSKTTTTSPTTEAAPTVSPTPPEPGTFVLQCIDPVNRTIKSDNDNQKELKLKNETVTLKFLLEENQHYVEITGDELDGSSLLWYDSNHQAGCVKYPKFGTTIPFYPLQNETYIFCVIQENSMTSPFDCGALSPQIDPKPSFWESNKTILILGFCGSLLVASLLTAITAFYCIRQHPSLLKGNKRVIIVESEAADAIVMPPTYYSDINYNSPSLVSRAGGYLTPTHHGVYGVPKFVPHLRTISEDVYPIPLYHVRRFYPNRCKRRTTVGCVSQPFEEHLYEAPPLPPNHPSEVRFRTGLGRRGCSQI